MTALSNGDCAAQAHTGLSQAAASAVRCAACSQNHRREAGSSNRTCGWHTARAVLCALCGVWRVACGVRMRRRMRRCQGARALTGLLLCIWAGALDRRCGIAVASLCEL